MAVAKLTDSVKTNDGAATSADVEAQLDRIRNDITALTQSLTSLGAEKADGYRRRIAELADEAAATSRSAVKSARSELNTLEQNLEGRIRSHPLQSIGIAAGVGFLAALLSRR